MVEAEEEDVVRSSLTNIAGPMDSAPTHQRNAETELNASITNRMGGSSRNL